MTKINKTYTIKQLADLAHVSIRTLHFYDETGLLKPSFVKNNGYRFYEERELLRLQQILFFRELEFPLEEIKKIMDAPGFNNLEALKDQKKLLEVKAKRLQGLVGTIDKTIKKMTNKQSVQDDELYDAFGNEEMQKYQEEAKERWGNTDAYKQSVERVRKMGKEGLAEIQKKGEELIQKLVAVMNKDPKSKEVQDLIAQHYDGLRAFYEPSLEMYKGLGDMYVADSRFTAYYDKFAPGLAEFMKKGMYAYVDEHQK